MARLLALTFLLAFAAWGQPKPSVVVVELFTSEGCSSCPPADQLLARLDGSGDVHGKRRPLAPRGVEVITLGEHVDYWDNLGWKDRFSSPLFSARQEDYGMAFNLSSIYTPQAVVNGAKEVLGSDARALSAAIREAASAPAAEVDLRMSSERTVVLRVGQLPEGSHEADILLAIAESGISTDVGAGENSGRHLTHAAVVHSISLLERLAPEHPGEYTAEARLNLRPEWDRSRLKVVLLVQDRKTRRILGAAAVKL